jgi:signal transduction histidine kinase
VNAQQKHRRLEFRLYGPGYLPRAVVLWSAAILAAGIFLIDGRTEVHVVVAEAYTIVVVMVSRVLKPRGILFVASGCMLLAIIGHMLSPGDVWGWTALMDLLFIWATIGLTAFMVSRNTSTDLALRKARDELAHFTRIATMAELTASLAHEVNQPVAAVVTNAQACLRWLSAQPPDLEEARKAVERIAKEGSRGAALIQRVRDMTKKSPPQIEWIDINDTIQETLALVHAEVVTHRVILETKLARDLRPVRGDRIQLQQVILNLVINAVEATDANGTFPRQVVVETGMEDAIALRVTVRDSGGGLAPQELEKVFAPFYTTKPGGMGMGLAVSRSIIQTHGGQLWAMPNAPRGAAFSFTLPISGQPLPIAATAAAISP